MNKANLMIFFVNGSAAFLFTFGILLLWKQSIVTFYEKLKMRHRLRARKNAMKEKNCLERHLEQLLIVSFPGPLQPRTFLLLEAVLFCMLFFLGSQNVTLPAAFLMAVLITILPYLLLRVRLEVRRRKGSYEGERLVADFLSQYRMCSFNVYRTIERVIAENQDTKVSNRLLFKLLMEIRNTGSREMIREATDSFAYGINTNWSRMLANNIRIAAETGMNVSLSVEDILIQLREARAITEARKRLNAEAARMVLFMVPLMYIGTVFLSVRYLDIPFRHFLENQLYTQQGFLLLISVIFLFFVNLAIMEMVNNQRFDY